MYTFNKMWGVVTPEEAAAKIEEQRKEITSEPQNLEEQAISLVGRDIYEKLIKGYTEKQWGRDCKELPSFIIKRLPVRLTFDNNYFNALYQGIPVGGYSRYANIQMANQKNVLYALGALYLLEMKYLSKIATSNEPDVPNKKSELFELDNWTYHYTPMGEMFACIEGEVCQLDDEN